jgi:transcription elongation GreA/GreB family factor
VNKQSIARKIVAQLVAELGLYIKAAKAAHAEATHEQSRAENKYDTRGLEASYLARGQSKQAAEIEAAIKEFEALPARVFSPGDGIEVGALVELVAGKQRSFYFVGPRAGGTEVVENDLEISVITKQSPLGQQLMGRRQGEKVNISIAGKTSEYRIASVT